MPRFSWLARWMLLAALLCMPCTTTAEQTDGAEEPIDGPEQHPISTAPVVVDGEVLFSVRGVSAFPADQRARMIAEKIKALARDPSFKADSLRSVETERFTQIAGGDRIVMQVFDADAQLEQAPRDAIVQVNLERTRRAIEEYRLERSSQRLVRDALKALLATLLLAAAFFLGVKFTRRLDVALEARYKKRVHSLGFKSFEVIRAERIWTAFRGFQKGLRNFIALVLVYAYLDFVLSLFPWTRWFGSRLAAYVTGPLATMGQAVLNYIPKLVFLVILIIITRFLLKIIRLFFDSIERGQITFASFAPEWARPTYRLTRVAVIGFAAVVAYPYIPGSDSDAFKGISLFIGVLFSLGSSSVISNVIAGYTMTYRRAFKVGDRVQINDMIGDVAEMRVLVTHLRSLKNEEIVIPNSVILNSQVVNYSSLAPMHGLILHTTVGIGYEVPWRQVEGMLCMAAERTPGVLKEPGPFVLQKSLGDFCVTYELNAFSSDARDMARMYADLHRNILDLFNEYGVQIMTPAYEGDPDRPKLVPKEQWYAAPAKPSS